MRNFKKLSALVVATALVLTSIVPAFAYTPVNDDKAEILRQLEIYQGISTDSFVPALDQDLTRGQGALLLARLFNKEADIEKMTDAEATEVLKDFADGSDVPAYVKKAVAYFVENKVINGASNNGVLTIDEAGSLYAEQFAALILRQMGYQDSHYTKAIEELAAVEGVAGLDSYSSLAGSEIKRDHAVGVMYGSLTGKYSGETATVISKIVEAKPALREVAEKHGLIEAETKALEVESVTSTNLKEIYVTFNNDVDETSAETASNYTLTNATLAADPELNGKTVTLKLTPYVAQQTNISVTIKDIKDLAGNKIAETKKSIKMFDSTVPSVTNVEVTGPKTLKVSFNEPIDSSVIGATSNFSIDNNTYSVASVTGTAGNSYVEVTLGSVLPDGKHSITVNATGTNANPELKDFAGFFLPKTTVEFNYSEDKTSPVVTLESVKQNEIKLKFNKPISVATQAYLSVYHTYNNNSSYAGSINWVDSQNVTVTFAQNYLPIGTATIYVNGGTDPNFLKDGWGNKFTGTTFASVVTADTTAPVVEKLEVVDSTHIDVTFSEAVTGGNTASNYKIVDSSNDSIVVSSAVLQTGNTYRLTTGTLNGGSYTITINGIKDTSVAQNKMAEYTANITVKDLIKPQVVTTGVYSTSKEKIVVSFDEAMATTGVYSVLDKANYQISYDNGNTWTDLSSITGANVTLNNGGKSVTISFPSAQAGLDGTGDLVRVARVADLAGNVTASFTTDVILHADDVTSSNIVADKVKATATNKVEFELDTPLSSIDVSKFKVTVNEEPYSATSATYINDGNKSTVTVTIAEANKFKTDISDLTSISFAADGVTTILGTKNSAQVTINTNIKDYVAPEMESVVTKDTSSPANGKIDRIDITFSEALYIASVQEADFTVEGYEITKAEVTSANKVVELTVKELANVDAGAKPKVTMVGSIADASAQRNSIGSQQAPDTTDGVAPILLSAVKDASDSTKIILTFSEVVKNATTGSITAEAFTLDNGTITNVNHEDGSSVITLTVTGAPTTVTVVVGKVVDANSNALADQTETIA